MIKKIILEVFDSIKRINIEKNQNSIPHSDFFQKDMFSAIGVDKEMFYKIINILKESHKILSIEITKEDKDRDIEKVEGYIEADLITTRTLKDFFQDTLVEMYEEEYHSRLLVHQLIKQIFPRMNSLANTPLGQIANKAIILEEYEKLLQNRYDEYNEDWKDNKLKEILEEEGEYLEKELSLKNKPKIEEKKPKEKRRAIDTDQYSDFNIATKEYSVNRVLQIFGVDFFLRVNLRKYNFEYINSAIENHIIDKKPDLLQLKNMLKKIRENLGQDSNLIDHLDEIYKLERTASRFLHFTS